MERTTNQVRYITRLNGNDRRRTIMESYQVGIKRATVLTLSLLVVFVSVRQADAADDLRVPGDHTACSPLFEPDFHEDPGGYFDYWDGCWDIFFKDRSEPDWPIPPDSPERLSFDLEPTGLTFKRVLIGRHIPGSHHIYLIVIEVKSVGNTPLALQKRIWIRINGSESV